MEGKKLQSQQAQLERQERAFSEHDEFAVTWYSYMHQLYQVCNLHQESLNKNG